MAKNIIACACARRIESRYWRTAMQCHCISASQPPLVAACYCHSLLSLLVVTKQCCVLAALKPRCFLVPNLSQDVISYPYPKRSLVVKEIPSTPDSIVGTPVIKVKQLTDLHSWKVVQHHPDDPRMWPSPALSSHNYPSEVVVTVLKV